MKDGESIPVEMSTEQGKLPEGVEQVLHNYWRRSMYQGKDYTYKGIRRLCGEQNFQMIEDMVGALLDAESRPKLYRSPLDRVQRLRYNEIVERANSQGIDSFYAVYKGMFDNPDVLRPVWEKARRMLFEYSGVLREAAIQAGLLEAPATTGITWLQRQKAWQAQIACKGRQKYLGLFKNKANAQAAYDKAAAEMGHIPGLPDIDKIWPTWEQQKARMAKIKGSTRMPIIYQQQDTHKERKFGLRPPEALRVLVERMKEVGRLVKHCMLLMTTGRLHRRISLFSHEDEIGTMRSRNEANDSSSRALRRSISRPGESGLRSIVRVLTMNAYSPKRSITLSLGLFEKPSRQRIRQHSDGTKTVSRRVRIQRSAWMRRFQSQWLWRNPAKEPIFHPAQSDMLGVYFTQPAEYLLLECKISMRTGL